MKILNALLLYIVLITCTAQSSEAQTVYITRTGAKYHRGSCQYLRKSKIAIAIKEAVERGYGPCSVCEPGSPSKEQKSSPVINPKNKDSSDNTDDLPVQKTSEVKSQQCTATTKTGTRCKRMTTNANGKCYQHQ